MSQVSKGTIIRTIMLIIVVINLLLRYTGRNILNIDETAVGNFVELIVSITTILVCYWKNNSMSKNAIKADQILKQLNESEM